MRAIETVSRHEIIELLNKDWMSHDGMWFFHCLQAFGIETTNRLNWAAIESLAPLEIERMKRLLGFEKACPETLAELREFFDKAAALVIPEFMGGRFSFREDGSFFIEMKPGQCFAYKGMKRLGVIADYRCGVIYRIECWMRALGLEYVISPPSGLCTMHYQGKCEHVLTFHFPPLKGVSALFL